LTPPKPLNSLPHPQNGLPLVAFSLNAATNKEGEEVERIWNEFELSDKLRERGWMIPAYAMAPDAQQTMCLRIVVREDLSLSMVESLIKDLEWAVTWLSSHYTFTSKEIGRFKEAKSTMRLDSIVRGRSCA